MISCLDVHHTAGGELLANAPGESGKRAMVASTIVCSGELGARPRVCVWCAETCEVKLTLHTITRLIHDTGILFVT